MITLLMTRRESRAVRHASNTLTVAFGKAVPSARVGGLGDRRLNGYRLGQDETDGGRVIGWTPTNITRAVGLLRAQGRKADGFASEASTLGTF